MWSQSYFHDNKKYFWLLTVTTWGSIQISYSILHKQKISSMVKNCIAPFLPCFVFNNLFVVTVIFRNFSTVTSERKQSRFDLFFMKIFQIYALFFLNWASYKKYVEFSILFNKQNKCFCEIWNWKLGFSVLIVIVIFML